MTDYDIKGWCPGALRPMASGDGLVLRIRARNGRLTPDQAQGIAGKHFRHARVHLALKTEVLELVPNLGPQQRHDRLNFLARLKRQIFQLKMVGLDF